MAISALASEDPPSGSVTVVIYDGGNDFEKVKELLTVVTMAASPVGTSTDSLRNL